MATMNVSLPAPMKDWVEARSANGRYANSSDYVRDLIRKDQERLAGLAEIQDLIDQGLASGPARPFDKKGFLARMKRSDG